MLIRKVKVEILTVQSYTHIANEILSKVARSVQYSIMLSLLSNRPVCALISHVGPVCNRD